MKCRACDGRGKFATETCAICQGSGTTDPHLIVVYFDPRVHDRDYNLFKDRLAASHNLTMHLLHGWCCQAFTTEAEINQLLPRLCDEPFVRHVDLMTLRRMTRT